MGYPVWDVSVAGGVLMGVVAIAHVIVSHFAIGGGLLLAVSETVAVRRGDGELRDLARRSSLILVLVSTVFGAVSGVAIWFVAGLISPGAISALIHTYVWGWAIEWTFFVVEIVAALLYYTTWGRISASAHLALAWIYFVAAYLSLVVINGIITFMLTPGRWLVTGGFWDGFFNPTYWPSLLLRTGISVMLATAFMLLAAQRASADARPRLVRYLGWWLVAGAVVSYGGYRWWEAALPAPVTAVFRGADPLLPGLASTRSLTLWALTGALVLGLALLVALPRAGRLPAAVAVMLATFLFFGGYERLREGIRKPFLVSGHLFSNGLRVADIGRLNQDGIGAATGWIAARAGADPSPERVGEEVFRVQCRSCHTLDGYHGIRAVLPSVDAMVAVMEDDGPGSGGEAFSRRCARCHPDMAFADVRDLLPSADEIRAEPDMIRDLDLGMITATLDALHEAGPAWTSAAVDGPRRPDDLRFPYMPPLVGTSEEMEALGAYLHELADPPASADAGGAP